MIIVLCIGVMLLFFDVYFVNDFGFWLDVWWFLIIEFGCVVGVVVFVSRRERVLSVL